jgi:hypothetical protein
LEEVIEDIMSNPMVINKEEAVLAAEAYYAPKSGLLSGLFKKLSSLGGTKTKQTTSPKESGTFKSLEGLNFDGFQALSFPSTFNFFK